MPLQSPTVRDLSLWNSRISKSVWEIYTPDKNSLYWSIMMAYLVPSAHSQNPGVFAMRLKNLTDDSGGNQIVMNQLKSFNPFKKKHAFHFEKTMSTVLQKCKKKINRSTKVRPEGANVEELKLAAVSEMLNCFIQVYSIDSSGIKNYSFYSPKSQSTDSTANLETLIIFHHPNTQMKNREKDTFGFGMEFQISQPLQEKALAFILRKDRLLREYSLQIQQVARNSQNFLISLLKSDVKHVVPRIYRLAYILAKLQNAGYNTNPLVEGKDGLSAFYFCISLPDSQHLNILYNYVSNNFYQSEETCRKPGDDTVLGLNNLKRALERDFKNSNEFSSVTPTAFKRYREVLRFNEYQMSIAKIVKDNQQKSADEIALALLEEYINYFLFQAVPNDERIQFEDYRKFSGYYENLDSYTCILLLDRLLSLKNKAYFELVQPLFLMMMSSKYFPREEHDHDGAPDSEYKSCAYRLIPFNYRMNFLKVLKEVIHKVQTGPGENIDSPTDMILLSVQSIPKDEFLLARLKASLEIAINIEVDDTQDVLTIFRTLQVFGEVLETSVTENFASGFLLSAFIPFDIKQSLINIRNDISHYKANVIQSRLNFETQIELFQKIQDELLLLYQVLEPVFSGQRLKMKEHIIQSARSLFHISKEELKCITTDREVWSQTQWEQFRSFAVKVFISFQKVVNEPFPQRNEGKKYFRKMKLLQDGTEALNSIFNFKTTFDDLEVEKELVDAQQNLRKILEAFESSEPTDDNIKDLKNTFDKYVHFLKQIFSLEINDAKSEIKCVNLVYLKENLRSHNAFEGEENLKIRQLVSELLEPSFEATAKLEESLRNSQALTDIDHVLEKTYLSNKNRKIIKTTFLSKTSENLKILEKFSYNSKDKALGQENETSAKILEMVNNDEYKKALLQHSSTFGAALERKFLKLVNQKMEFLIEKINLIEKILIDEEDEIRDLVKWGRSDEIKKHNRFLMRQRYVMESDVKSSLEMLLFDCMNIMDKRKDLADICTKMNDMFAGVDLRDILSHGNILVDSLGAFLDPDDFPSEVINKMLELIEDRKALVALSNLWMKEKPMSGEQLKELIKNQDISDIKRCPRWEGYVVLLPTRR